MRSILDDFDPTVRPHDAGVQYPRPVEQPSLIQRLFSLCSRGLLRPLEAIFEEFVNEIGLDETVKNLFEFVNGMGCIHIAAKKGHTNVVKFLLGHAPALLKWSTEDGRTAIMLAAFEGHLETLQVLMTAIVAASTVQESVLSAVDSRGNNVVHFSAWGGHETTIRYLLSSLPSDSSSADFAALEKAVNASPVPSFVKDEIVHKRNLDGLLPIQMAAAGGHESIVRLLFDLHSESGGLGDDSSVTGMTTVHRACAYGLSNIVSLLIGNPEVDINARTVNGSTPIHFAAQHGHQACVEFLVSVDGVSIDEQNEYGLTPLHFAAFGGYTDIVVLLLSAGADASQRTASGETSLSMAAAAGHVKICEVLLGTGKIDPLAKDASGKTALDRAADSGYHALAALILAASEKTVSNTPESNLVDVVA